MSFNKWFLTACALGSGYLGFVKWSNQTIDETEKVAERLGVIESPEVKKSTSVAYQLGRSIAKFVTYSNVERLAKEENAEVPQDLRQRSESNQAEIDGQLKLLSLEIGFRGLDYSAPTDDFVHSSGITALGKLIRTSHGERVERAFKLGVSVESVFWRAQFLKFNRPGSAAMLGNDDAFLVLGALNEDAREFGVDGVSENDLDGADKESFNRSLQRLTLKLNSQLESAL